MSKDVKKGHYPNVKANRTPKARKPRKLSGKVIGWDVDMKTPNQWLDPGWKLFREKKFKRWDNQ